MSLEHAVTSPWQIRLRDQPIWTPKNKSWTKKGEKTKLKLFIFFFQFGEVTQKRKQLRCSLTTLRLSHSSSRKQQKIQTLQLSKNLTKKTKLQSMYKSSKWKLNEKVMKKKTERTFLHSDIGCLFSVHCNNLNKRGRVYFNIWSPKHILECGVDQVLIQRVL